jgi:hypothetical protein
MKTKSHHGLAATEAAAGAVAGAAIGSIAGPPGAIAGALIGGALGAAAGIAVESATRAHDAADAKLDEAIGVYGGDLGAPNLEHPPAIIGACSSGSSGGGARQSHAPASGPMSNAENDD